MLCLGVLGRKKNSASAEVYMLYLDPYEFADATTEFVNYLEPQLMTVIVNTVKKTLELIDGQITDDLTETFVLLGAFAFSAQTFCILEIILADLHTNVKSTGLINVSVSVSVAILNNPYGIQQKTKSMKNRKI